jgi:predicted DNA-binding transcriptional regulator AlpA
MKRKPPKPPPRSKPSPAAEVRAALDPDPAPKPTDEIASLVERRRSAVEQARPPPPVRLLSRNEVCARIGVSYPTIWKWMRDDRFPRSRVMNDGKICWIESEVEKWILNLPVQTLKPADEEDHKKIGSDAVDRGAARER